MGKTRLGRKRKFSHHKYQTLQDKKETIENSPSYGLPLKYQFALRNVPNAVLNVPSAYNFTNVITVLLKDKVLKNQWNIIKHSELFLMLCTFITQEGEAPQPEKTIMVNTDLTWKVIVTNMNVNNEIASNVPQTLCIDSFVTLLDLVDQCTICPGIVDKDTLQLSYTGGRNGVFKDKYGNIQARNNGKSIHTTRCKVILRGQTMCEPCKLYKKTLLTMVSSQKIKSCRQEDSKNNTNADSHCPWMYLSEHEKQERINKCREDRHRSTKKIKRLEEKFKEVSEM